MLPWTSLSYSLDDYPFPSHVADSLDVDDLTDLSADIPRHTWETDQSTPWHRRFYDGFMLWSPTYVEFVHEMIAPHVGEPFYYQRVPTFRVHLPGNVAVGEFHTDAVYNHPPGEVTFWTPMTRAYDTCSVWIADDDDELHAVDARPGEVIEFSAVTRRHGNKLNVTGHSRVSFDFRCLPARLLPKTHGPRTKHTGMRFIPGEYYALERVNA